LKTFFYLSNLRSFVVYQLPILVCDAEETGLCDQVLIRVNLTDSPPNDTSMNSPTYNTAPKTSTRTKNSQPSFSYKYFALTVQQTSQATSLAASAAASESIESDSNDYYLDEAYIANERFYTEIRLNTIQPAPTGIEFELANCAYTPLNVTYTNQTLNNPPNLTSNQLKSLFLLNKHNGVISSRSTVNEMQPGTYTFTVRLRSNHFYSSMILESTQFKLIVVPENSLLSSQSRLLYNYFRFSREMYKFETNSNGSLHLGQIKLVEKVQPEILAMHNRYLTASDLGKFKSEYTLVESTALRVGKVLDNIEMDIKSGELRLRNNGTVAGLVAEAESVAKSELVVYGLAKVWIGDNVLEYVCEIVLDLRGFRRNGLEEKIAKRVQFGRETTRLRLYEDREVNSSVYRFVASHESGNVQYSIVFEGGGDGGGDDKLFDIESGSGLLRLIRPLRSLGLEFGVRACLGEDCGETWCVLDVVDLNNNAPVFEKDEYESGIREDSLPGTVVVTVGAQDDDQAANRRVEYFILDGDSANQVGIKKDGFKLLKPFLLT